jgi:lipopolysaccharide export system permease protein
MPPMNCMFRYMSRQILWPLLFAILVVSGIVWMSQSLRFVDLVLNKGLPAYNMFYLAFLVLPMFTSVFLPIILFGVVVFAYSKMNQDSELVVWRSCGKSPIAIAGPAIAGAAIVMAMCYALNAYYMPLAYHEFKDLQSKIRNNYSDILLREGAFNEIGGNLTIYVRERTAAGELLGILVHDRRKGREPVTMMAERGALVRTESGPRVVMVKGNRQTVKPKEDRLSILFFDRYTLDLGTVKTAAEQRSRQPRERFIDELFRADPTGRSGYANDNQRIKFQAEAHHRLASPLLALAFALLALTALLPGEFNRRGQGLRITWVTGAMVVVQAVSISLYHLAGTTLAAAPFLYLLPISTIAASLWLLLRARRRYPAVDRADPEPTGAAT